MATDLSTDPGSRKRRSAGVLAALLVGLGAVTLYQLWPARAVPGGAPLRIQPNAAEDRTGMGDAPPDVRLDSLQAGAPEIAASNRNPFRFQPRTIAAPAQPGPVPAAPRPSSSTALGAAGSGGEGAAGGGQAPPAPITLKFIGTIEAPGIGKIAALSDGKFIFHGREGDVIEGRYRIVKIGVESIILEHVDGRGRQTIRLTG